MTYVNELSEALKATGITWSSARYITPRYIEILGLVDANSAEILNMIQEGVKTEEIVFQNRYFIEHVNTRDTPHYTFNDLKGKAPYGLLVREPPFYNWGYKPYEIIKSAQDLIRTASDDTSFDNIKLKLSKLEKSVVLADKVLGHASSLSSDEFLKAYPTLGPINKDAMNVFESFISDGFTIKTSTKYKLNKELEPFEKARQQLKDVQSSDIQAILSINLDYLSNDLWYLIQGKAQFL